MIAADEFSLAGVLSLVKFSRVARRDGDTLNFGRFLWFWGEFVRDNTVLNLDVWIIAECLDCRGDQTLPRRL